MEESQTAQEEISIANKILAYLLDHPDAEDSLEGVVEWWLHEQEIRHRTTEAKAALDCLVKKGFVIEKKTEGRPPVYRFNPERKVQELRKIVGKVKSVSKGRWLGDKVPPQKTLFFF